MTPSGIEPATFRFVAQHLNHFVTAVPCNVCTAYIFYLTNMVCHIPPIYTASLFYITNIGFHFPPLYTTLFKHTKYPWSLHAAIYSVLVLSDKMSFVTFRRYIQGLDFIWPISFVTSRRHIQLSCFISQNIPGHFPPLCTASLFYPTKCRLSLPADIYRVLILFGQYRLSLPAAIYSFLI